MKDDEQADDAEPEARGWAAIDSALEPIYGEQQPKHYAAILPAYLGGNDPLQGISVYLADSPTPHFHYVTYGFTELYEKESSDAETSSYGFELTFRLARGTKEVEPPSWPLNMLQNIARYVFKTGNTFDERHHMTLNGPIALGEATDITAIVFVLDPQLGAVDSLNGQFKFLQIVGLCTDEYELIKAGYFDPVVERVMAAGPLGVTEIYRDSILKDAHTKETILSESPDATQNELFGTVVEWEPAEESIQVRLAANLIANILLGLPIQVGKGEFFTIYGNEQAVMFKPGAENGWEDDDGLLVVSLTPPTLAEIAQTLQERRGNYQFSTWPQLQIEVIPTDIKDSDGNVLRTVG